MTSTASPMNTHTMHTNHRHCADELLAAVRQQHRPVELTVATVMTFAGIPSLSEVARRAGVSRRTVHRWVHSGLDVWTADRLAVTVAHSHPATVFGPGWFDLAFAEEAA